jgi:endonuclease III related protein
LGKRNTRLKSVLIDVYDRLFACYGLQHWWPGDTPFEVIVGAILTQSTSWSNVEKAIRNLKQENALDAAVMRAMPLDRLAALVRASGYYNAKAHKIKALVDWLATYEDDLAAIFARDTATLRQQLLGVFGIGEETADSILLYAGMKPVFVIDAYTRRIVDRLGLCPDGNRYIDYQRLFLETVSPDVRLYNEYHALLVRHGKDACRKTPRCQECVLADICARKLP